MDGRAVRDGHAHPLLRLLRGLPPREQPHICHTLNIVGIDSEGSMQDAWNVPVELLVALLEGLGNRVGATRRERERNRPRLHRHGQQPGGDTVFLESQAPDYVHRVVLSVDGGWLGR